MRHPISDSLAAGVGGPACSGALSILTRLSVALILGFAASQAIADTGYGEEVDAFCASHDGSTPFADLGGNSGNNGCLLCHQDTSGNGAQPGTWSWWRNGTLALFCTSTPANRAPDGRIIAPASDLQIGLGGTLSFEGTGSDPDGDALSFGWDFGVGTATGPGPHDIAYPNAGTFTARLTVSDGTLADPTPATRRITVGETGGCTDADGDGWFAGGASCAPLDCNDADPAVNPGAIEDCGDGLDNDCNGLTDSADPEAVGCAAGCLDSDGDRFSPEGGLCGPIDCDDTDPAVSPGAAEVCTDAIDNDCDFYLDETDPDCNGDDCQRRLMRDPGSGILVGGGDWYRAATPLDGLVVSDRIRILIADRQGIELVQWFVDGRPHSTDGNAPWVLATRQDEEDDDHEDDEDDHDDHEDDDREDHDDEGHDGDDDRDEADGRFDTRQLQNGWHSISVDITMDDGNRQQFTAALRVDNAAANQPPTCTIDAPAASVTVEAGDRVHFAGTGADPDHDLPLHYLWNLDGAAPDVMAEDPGDIRLWRPGRFSVRFTVTDATGLACEQPAVVDVRVEDDDDDDDDDDEHDDDDHRDRDDD